MQVFVNTHLRWFLGVRLMVTSAPLSYYNGYNVRRCIITRYFRFLYVLGFCVVSYDLAFRFSKTIHYEAHKQLVLAPDKHKQLTTVVMNYIMDISHQFQTIGFFSTFGINSEYMIREGLLSFFSRGFISGISARFGNFAKWSDFVLSQKPRLKHFVWDLYFKNHHIKENDSTMLAALLLHKYQYKSIVYVPRIILTPNRVGHDFFLPLSRYATRFETFFLLFLLLKTHVFLRNRIASDRLFWSSSQFNTYYKEKNVAINLLPFSYVFRLYGRNHKAMQLWEYEAINSVFYHSSIKVSSMKAELYKDV
jgi:hypothetical protein